MRLAARLSELVARRQGVLLNSGAEAVECALKLARKPRPGGEIVVLEGASTAARYGALSATPQEAKQAPFAPLVPGFRGAPATRRRSTLPVDDGTAAVLLEPIQGESGIHPLDRRGAARRRARPATRTARC